MFQVPVRVFCKKNYTMNFLLNVILILVVLLMISPYDSEVKFIMGIILTVHLVELN